VFSFHSNFSLKTPHGLHLKAYITLQEPYKTLHILYNIETEDFKRITNQEETRKNLHHFPFRLFSAAGV
jgi:hypothetical protein